MGLWAGSKIKRAGSTYGVLAVVAAMFLAILPASAWATHATVTGTPTGAIFTTEIGCTTVNANTQYQDKDDVYLNGGPRREGSAGLPDGHYFVQVTEPDGTVLGKSLTAAVSVTGGEMDLCYQLSSILKTASSTFTEGGYDDTTSPGGVYKVWISSTSTFDSRFTKTDNFKVGACVDDVLTEDVDECEEDDGTIDELGFDLTVNKWYDSDADGTWDTGEVAINNWKINITESHIQLDEETGLPVEDEDGNPLRNAGTSYDGWTQHVEEGLEDGDYVVSETMPTETNWYNTGLQVDGAARNPSLTSVLLAGLEDDTLVEFGNVCTVGNTGGSTIGFWSNKNGFTAMASFTSPAPVGRAAVATALENLNLRSGNGNDYNLLPGSTPDRRITDFQKWLNAASATNMANMLSAQMAGSQLNVWRTSGLGSALIYAPWSTSDNAAGFATLNALINEANISLGTTAGSNTTASGPLRTYQENLKNVFDAVNNNTQQVTSATACAFSFGS